MKHDLELFKFGGACVGVAEDELQASLNDCSAKEYEEFINKLFSEYVVAGKPGKVKRWLRPRLEQRFLSVGPRPQWVSGQPAWPWYKGEPMVFLGQLAVPENDVSVRYASPGEVLYVFAARVLLSSGFRMEYRVVKQEAGMKGLVALVESEEPPHTPANTRLVRRKLE